MNDVSTARDIMIIEWKDPNMRLHGKRHKNDRYYFRWHYGKQRRVCLYKEYVDKPTEAQVSAREAFTELRREVARQLKDANLRAAWMRRFEADNEGYKFLHTYVYAQMKAGVTLTQPTTSRDVPIVHLPHPQSNAHRVSPSNSRRPSSPRSLSPTLIIYNHAILTLFLPAHIPKTNSLLI